MGVIDYRDSRAIYEQIATYYERLILRGILKEDEQLPSVRALAMELSTNPNTVQKAFSRMEAEGFIYSVKGKGNFVSRPVELLEKKRQELVSGMSVILHEARELGLDEEKIFTEARRNTK